MRDIFEMYGRGAHKANGWSEMSRWMDVRMSVRLEDEGATSVIYYARNACNYSISCRSAVVECRILHLALLEVAGSIPAHFLLFAFFSLLCV